MLQPQIIWPSSSLTFHWKIYLIMEISFSLFSFAQSGCLMMKLLLYAYILSLRKAKASYSRYLVEGCRVCLRSDTVKYWMKELHVKPGLSCGRLGICIHQKMGFHTTLRNNGWWVSDVRICVPSRGEGKSEFTWSHEPQIQSSTYERTPILKSIF